ncbi:MAG: alpha/beta hydrolase [Alphaproteobacteria bacterium]|nr:alpha/beta hydrolase [Alphaproteobacteria bacterium]
MGLVRRAVLLVAVGYVSFTTAVFFLQPRLVYGINSPSRVVSATPAKIGLAFESVKFTTEDDVQLDGWYLPAEQPRGVLLFFHGNGGNISHRLNSLRIFNALGLSTFIFDYRGYGRSDGKTTEQGTYLDADAAWRYLTAERGISEQDIVVFGRSLGGSIAAYLAMKKAPQALILESTFTSVPDVGAQRYPLLPVHLLSRFQYPTREYLKAVSAPVLITHSAQDTIIPFEHGRALFAVANEPKSFLEIAGGHNIGFLQSGKTYTDGLDSFLTAHLGR